MIWLLRFAGTFNVVAGLAMATLYHEGFRLLGVPKPALALPVQMMGGFVVLFGVGYHMVARRPREHRGVLLLGFWSKLIGSLLTVWAIGRGQLPGWFFLVVLLADIVYLLPFYVILRRIDRPEN